MKKRNDLEKQIEIKDKYLAWFNHFVDYVGNIDSNLYNEACEYADELEDC
tara:strand:- start:617 stop:766 length:150 start_codon:yes stop_codon:yes gene_type:complete